MRARATFGQATFLAHRTSALSPHHSHCDCLHFQQYSFQPIFSDLSLSLEESSPLTMTRHTAEFLRTRSSNLSLRSAPMEHSMAGLRVGSPAQTSRPGSGVGLAGQERAESTDQSAHSSVFVAMGMHNRPPSENLVCTPCSLQLRPGLRFARTDEIGACKLCAYRLAKPEAFTKPYCDFMTENPTVFHSVDHFKTKLRSVGYNEVCPQLILGGLPSDENQC